MSGTVAPRCQNPYIERLFDLEDSPGGRSGAASGDLPLAARMRPTSLGEFVGQDHLLGRGSALRTAIEEGRPHSMILYGPPGTGKTTLAREFTASTGVTPAASARSSSSTRSTASTRPSRTRCCRPSRRGWWC
jgi:replication-associated recombination protein RarA